MKAIVYIFLFLLPCNLLSSDYESEEFEKLLERIAIETGTSPVLDDYEFLIDNPISLKNTTIGNFLKIPGFTTSEARKIVNLCVSDSINSIADLEKHISLTPDQKKMLSVFSTFDNFDDDNSKYLKLRLRNKFYLIEPTAINQNKFMGDELDLYQRLNVKYNQFAMGLVMDKDLGEKKINDFQSGYFSSNISGYKAVLGDFYIESGLGSLLWKSFGVRKSADVIYPMSQYGSCIHEYSSTFNSKFFRGIALEKFYSISANIDMNIKLWASSINRDGNYDSTTNTISSVYKQGYYRTSSEIDKIGRFKETAYGFDYNFRYLGMIVGTNALYLDYNKYIMTESHSDFLGKGGFLYSIYGIYDIQNFTFSSELSQDGKKNTALKFGTQFKNDNWNLICNLRSFPTEFRSPFGFNFGESSIPSNEWGLYTGIRYSGFKSILFSSYFDYFGTYGRSYYLSQPYTAYDFLIQSEIKLENTMKGLIRLSLENKPYDEIFTEFDTTALDRHKYKFRIDVSRKLLKKLEAKMRFDAVFVVQKEDKNPSDGLAFMTEIKYLITDWLIVGSRFSLFNTDDYSSSVWQYELASSGYMTTVPLYGKGYRSFVYADFEPIENLKIRFRYSILEKNNTNTMGSGILEISGNQDQRIVLQMDYRI